MNTDSVSVMNWLWYTQFLQISQPCYNKYISFIFQIERAWKLFNILGHNFLTSEKSIWFLTSGNSDVLCLYLIHAMDGGCLTSSCVKGMAVRYYHRNLWGAILYIIQWNDCLQLLKFMCDLQASLIQEKLSRGSYSP